MSGLASEIARAKVEAFERNEAALADDVSSDIGRAEVDEATRRAVQPFVDWCNQREVRYCAAKPTTVAAFVFDQCRIRVPADRVLNMLDAIERIHDAYQLANPVACHAVSAALAKSFPIDPPRSWPKDDKARFLRLPVEIQSIISRREKDRDKWFRQQQQKSETKEKAAA